MQSMKEAASPARKATERTLRKLCVSGVVQTIRFHEDGAEFIPPAEWKRADFNTSGVYLNKDDLFQQWVEFQNKALPETCNTCSHSDFSQRLNPPTLRGRG
jgi:hypothetical protein